MSPTTERHVRSCEKDAFAGRDEAQYQLGLLYSSGKGGIPVDYVTAHMWLNLSAQQGNAGARELRRELAMDMSRTEIAEAQRLAREWINRQIH